MGCNRFRSAFISEISGQFSLILVFSVSPCLRGGFCMFSIEENLSDLSLDRNCIVDRMFHSRLFCATIWFRQVRRDRRNRGPVGASGPRYPSVLLARRQGQQWFRRLE